MAKNMDINFTSAVMALRLLINCRNVEFNRTIKTVWEQYVFGKQTYTQLASKYRVSRRAIQRWIDAVEQSKSHPKDNRALILLADTTYFGRGFGVMVFRDYERGKNIYWK